MSELKKWYWNAAGMQDRGQPDDRPFVEAAEVEAVVKDAKVVAEYVASIPQGTPCPFAEAKRLLEMLEKLKVQP